MKRRRALLFSLSVVLALCAACGWWLHRERQQYRLNRQLIEVLTRGDTKTALALVNEGADPNTRNAPSPALSLQLLLNQYLHHTPPPTNDSPTAFLMACGVNWNPDSDTGRQPITLPECLLLLQAMLVHGAEVRTNAADVGTALHGAIDLRRVSTVQLLLEHDVDVNATDGEGATPLMNAAVSDMHLTRLVLSHGAKVNLQAKDGDTALAYAVWSPDAKRVVSLLLAHGINPNLCRKNGVTPLMIAQTRKLPDIVRLLKQHGAK